MWPGPLTGDAKIGKATKAVAALTLTINLGAINAWRKWDQMQHGQVIDVRQEGGSGAPKLKCR